MQLSEETSIWRGELKTKTKYNRQSRKLWTGEERQLYKLHSRMNRAKQLKIRHIQDEMVGSVEIQLGSGQTFVPNKNNDNTATAAESSSVAYEDADHILQPISDAFAQTTRNANNDAEIAVPQPDASCIDEYWSANVKRLLSQHSFCPSKELTIKIRNPSLMATQKTIMLTPRQLINLTPRHRTNPRWESLFSPVRITNN